MIKIAYIEIILLSVKICAQYMNYAPMVYPTAQYITQNVFFNNYRLQNPTRYHTSNLYSDSSDSSDECNSCTCNSCYNIKPCCKSYCVSTCNSLLYVPYPVPYFVPGMPDIAPTEIQDPTASQSATTTQKNGQDTLTTQTTTASSTAATESTSSTTTETAAQSTLTKTAQTTTTPQVDAEDYEKTLTTPYDSPMTSATTPKSRKKTTSPEDEIEDYEGTLTTPEDPPVTSATTPKSSKNTTPKVDEDYDPITPDDTDDIENADPPNPDDVNPDPDNIDNISIENPPAPATWSTLPPLSVKKLKNCKPTMVCISKGKKKHIVRRQNTPYPLKKKRTNRIAQNKFNKAKTVGHVTPYKAHLKVQLRKIRPIRQMANVRHYEKNYYLMNTRSKTDMVQRTQYQDTPSSENWDALDQRFPEQALIRNNQRKHMKTQLINSMGRMKQLYSRLF